MTKFNEIDGLKHVVLTPEEEQEHKNNLFFEMFKDTNRSRAVADYCAANSLWGWEYAEDIILEDIGVATKYWQEHYTIPTWQKLNERMGFLLSQDNRAFDLLILRMRIQAVESQRRRSMFGPQLTAFTNKVLIKMNKTPEDFNDAARYTA